MMSDDARHPKRPTFPWLYAIPTGRLPDAVECAGREWRLTQTFKHDFFAATGVYDSGEERAVLKVGRITSFYGLPLRWIGTFLRNRESRIYKKVEHLAGVPKWIGDVGKTGFLHEFVPGRPLERHEQVSDDFFPALRKLLDDVHALDIAYVDLNKRQNILLGADLRPYLIDFQISYDWRRNGLARVVSYRWLLRRLQRADDYHYCKHKRRLRPDQLTEEERRTAEHVGFLIRAHRMIARPLIQIRRRVLSFFTKREKMDVSGSSAK